MVGTDLYWIEGPWPGRLAIMPRPRGGDWLEDEVRAWESAGVNVVVSLLTTEEIAELDLGNESDLCTAAGIEFVAFPVPDGKVPSSLRATADLVHQLEVKLAEGNKVVIHCRVGIGRSAILAACLLVSTGINSNAAFDRIAKARGCPVPDTAEQRQWVDEFQCEIRDELAVERSPKLAAECQQIREKMHAGQFRTHEEVKKLLQNGEETV